MSKPILSVVVVEFNMAREIERTILSLSDRYQHDVHTSDYEVVLVDNGSSAPSNKDTLRKIMPSLRIHQMKGALASPAAALNMGLAMARGEFVGSSIDGARMFSPGVLSLAIRALRSFRRGVVYPLGFHLGHQPQNLARQTGYNQQIEDRMLADIDWVSDGYRLFDVAVIAPGQAVGWFRSVPEATALFMTKPLWEEVEGFDEAFRTPGGGLVNLDTFARACRLPDVVPVVLLGEGTFHQFHGGVASNAAPDDHPWKQFHAEYESIRGKAFVAPAYHPFCFGCVHPNAFNSISDSVK
jgi:hypothetical protein